MTAKPRPGDDVAIAKICRWLREQKLTGHITLSGAVELTPTDEAYTELLSRKAGQQSHGR